VTRLRSLLLARRWPALALVVATLAVRMIVPAGMMPGAGPGGPTLVVCSGHMTMPETAMPGMAMPGTAKPGDAGRPDPAKADAPCAFTGLLAAALDTAALPVLPPAPPAVVAVRLPALIPVVLRPLRLWPPRRGPPLPASA
jgi:hypothetical protein